MILNEKDLNYSEYMQGTFAALRIPAYRIYFGALLMQMAAMNMQIVANRGKA